MPVHESFGCRFGEFYDSGSILAVVVISVRGKCHQPVDYFFPYTFRIVTVIFWRGCFRPQRDCVIFGSYEYEAVNKAVLHEILLGKLRKHGRLSRTDKTDTRILYWEGACLFFSGINQLSIGENWQHVGNQRTGVVSVCRAEESDYLVIFHT